MNAPSAQELWDLAAQVINGEADAAEIEEFLLSGIEGDIFGLQHDLDHCTADATTKPRLAELNRQRFALLREWQSTLADAFYRADKLEELDDAPDAASAADAVIRWNLLDGQPRQPRPLEPAEPPFPLPTEKPALVHGAVLRAITKFLADCETPDRDPPRLLLKAETGSAKTRISLKAIAAWIADRKKRRPEFRVAFMVPAHKLGRQVLADAKAAGIDAAVFEGRDRSCKNQEAVKLAREAGVDDINAAVCGNGQGKACPVRDWCNKEGYFSGLARAANADMIICANNFAFDSLPAKIRRDIGLVVIDEDFASLADTKFPLSLSTFDAAVTQQFPVLTPRSKKPDAGETINLQLRFHNPLIKAANNCLGGYLWAPALQAEGFTALSEAAAEMRDLTWRRKVPVDMQPDMSLTERKEIATAAAVNSQLSRIAALTRAIDDVLSKGEQAAGYISVWLDTRRSGSQIMLTVRGQKSSAKWLAGLPILMLNATGGIEDVRRIFPDAKLAEVPRRNGIISNCTRSPEDWSQYACSKFQASR
jgi:hypothetical protein